MFGLICIGFCDLSFFIVVNDLQSLRASLLDLFRGLYFSLKYFNNNYCLFGSKSDFLTYIFSVLSPFFIRSIVYFYSLGAGGSVPGPVPGFRVVFGVNFC